MSLNFLDFEQPIAELEAKIDSLTAVSRRMNHSISILTKKLNAYGRRVWN